MRRRRRDSSRLPIWKAHSFRPVDKLNNSSKRRYRCCRDAYTAESYSSRYINLFFLYTVDGASSKERHVDFWGTCREGRRPLERPHRDPERTKTEEDQAWRKTARLLEGRLALNLGLILTRVSFSFGQKHFLGLLFWATELMGYCLPKALAPSVVGRGGKGGGGGAWGDSNKNLESRGVDSYHCVPHRREFCARR